MTIRTGSVVNHTGALEWGAGKVMEVTADRATIEFSDGKSRKIAASHFIALQPADAASYSPPPEVVPAVKTRAAAKPRKRTK
ncbi:MAG: hypothetical protein FD174_2379 [Geobacteraceae bacterium]|nr:MAG: hypothetical protein FD174_2379 [Geobacteraceae bacterium]